ncbi:hypothetical protein Pfo_026909 [Paulownia fortunei]|nr:hypothetical protein Pfo_026909 [Paulownia fortunei]
MEHPTCRPWGFSVFSFISFHFTRSQLTLTDRPRISPNSRPNWPRPTFRRRHRHMITSHSLQMGHNKVTRQFQIRIRNCITKSYHQKYFINLSKPSFPRSSFGSNSYGPI